MFVRACVYVLTRAGVCIFLNRSRVSLIHHMSKASVPGALLGVYYVFHHGLMLGFPGAGITNITPVKIGRNYRLTPDLSQDILSEAGPWMGMISIAGG